MSRHPEDVPIESHRRTHRLAVPQLQRPCLLRGSLALTGGRPILLEAQRTRGHGGLLAPREG